MGERLLQLDRRLAFAEARVRWLTRAGVVLILLSGGVLAARPAAVQPELSTVRAPFRVVDDQGRTLLQVDASENRAQPGQRLPRIELFSPVGKRSAGLYVTPGGGTVAVTDWQGEGGASMGAVGSSGILHILDRWHEPVVTLRAMEQGGRLEVYTRRGDTLAAVVRAGENGGYLAVHDRSGKRSFSAP